MFWLPVYNRTGIKSKHLENEQQFNMSSVYLYSLGLYFMDFEKVSICAYDLVHGSPLAFSTLLSQSLKMNPEFANFRLSR